MEREYEICDVPDEASVPMVVKTGLTPGEGAVELLVFYHRGDTYVVTSGEFSNAEPTRTKGTVSLEDVLADYLEEVKEEGLI